jgi:hypothetical protein
MSESYIQLPTEGAGKKSRAIQKTISAQTVYSEYQIADSILNFKGSYVICLRVVGSTSANYQFLSLYNPAASGRIFKVKAVILIVDTGSIGPNQIRATRTTSLGTGTSQTAVKKDSTFSASVSSIVSALTGNAGLDRNILGMQKAGPTSPSGTYQLLNVNYKDATLEADQIVLREGEGIVIQQLSAGAISEYLFITIEWEEYTTT